MMVKLGFGIRAGALASVAVLLSASSPLRLSAQQTPLQARYADAANRLVAAALRDSAAWNKLARLADGFGNRISGSDALERAIDWVLAEMKREGLENVRGEPAMVPHWVRGNESAELVSPRPMKLPM